MTSNAVDERHAVRLDVPGVIEIELKSVNGSTKRGDEVVLIVCGERIVLSQKDGITLDYRA